MPDDAITAQRAPGQHSAPNGTSPYGDDSEANGGMPIDEDMINPDMARKAHSAFPNGAFSSDFEPTEVSLMTQRATLCHIRLPAPAMSGRNFLISSPSTVRSDR